MDTEHEEKWQFVDQTLREIAQVSAVRSLFQPVRDYAREIIDRMSWMLGLLVGLQVVIVLLTLGDFILNLRSTIFVQTY